MVDQMRPLPLPDIETRPYWEAAKRHELKLPKCRDCGRFMFPPRSACSQCLTRNVEWVEMSGRGTVYTFVTMHDTFIRGMEPPFVAAEVELEEQAGLRITCNILECAVDKVYFGMPVEVTFQDVTDEVTLPQFRPRAR